MLMPRRFGRLRERVELALAAFVPRFGTSPQTALARCGSGCLCSDDSRHRDPWVLAMLVHSGNPEPHLSTRDVEASISCCCLLPAACFRREPTYPAVPAR